MRKIISRKEILFLMGASIFLINAGSSPSYNSSENASITSTVSQNRMELENGLRIVEGLIYSKKFKSALNQLRVLENKFQVKLFRLYKRFYLESDICSRLFRCGIICPLHWYLLLRIK